MCRSCRLLLVAALVLASPASAQGPGTKFGAIVGGATLSDLSSPGASTKSRWGGTAGILLGANAGRTAVTIEGNWMQAGGGDTRLDYIEVPLTLGAAVATRDGYGRGRLYTGVSAAFKVSCDSPEFACDAAKGTIWGWPIGIQLAKLTGTGSFFGIDVRYTVPLSDAFDVGNVVNRPWAFRAMFGKRLGSTYR